MDLAEFLLARIAEDEEAARAALGRSWHAQGWAELRTNPHDDPSWIQIATDGEARPDNARPEVRRFDVRPSFAHIARHDPTRVLAECEAKRRIVNSRPAIDVPGPCLHVVHDEVQRQREYVWRVLASPYADHPDYQQDWKP